MLLEGKSPAIPPRRCGGHQHVGCVRGQSKPISDHSLTLHGGRRWNGRKNHTLGDQIAPRQSSEGTDPATIDQEMELRLEAEMPEATEQALEVMGHRVARRRPGIYDGKVQLILRDPQTGVLTGASDPRGDGQAVGL